MSFGSSDGIYYGLTASDLKAAANLASSTTNIAKNTINYGGMLNQLNALRTKTILI